MSKRKKLIPERTCESFRVVEASNDQKRSIGELPSARVFIAIRTTATSQLTNQQRADISAAVKFNFSADDWRIIDQAREFFTIIRREERAGVSAKELAKKLKQIDAAARSLLDAVAVRGKVDEIAWARLRDAEAPAFQYDDAYPIVSQFAHRAHLALEEADKDAQRKPLPTAWDQLVWRLGILLESKNQKVTNSKPADHAAPAKLSPFAKFVVAVIGTLPVDVAPSRPGSNADAEAISTAWKKFRPSK